MDKRKQAIRALCKSEYLDKWILSLKDNPIFSVDKNLRPCVKIENGFQSSVWDGLNLLECYAKRHLNNQEVDDFIVKLIRDSIQKYNEDTETNPLLKLNSSYIILNQLLQILLCEPKLIERINFLNFVDIYISSQHSLIYSLLEGLQKINIVKYVQENFIFEIYRRILEKDNIGGECYKILYDLSFINPTKNLQFLFYQYAKTELFKLNAYSFPQMGSFYDYPDDQYQMISKKDILVVWLKKFSKYVDKENITKDIETFFSNKKSFLKRAGLAIVNIRFTTLKKFFYSNFEHFLTDIEFYSDLVSLMKKNIHNIKLELIKDKIKNGTFGNDARKEMLKNHIFGILKDNCDPKLCADLPYMQESTKTLNEIKNINKMMYIIDNPKENDINYIYNQIQLMDPIEALNTYNNSNKKSYYYSEVFCDAFLKLINNDFEFIIKNLDNFDSKLINIILGKFDDNDEKIISLLSEFVPILNKKEYFNKCISNVLFKLYKLINKGKIKDAFDVLSKIDYKQIDTTSEVTGSSYIDDCINQNLHTFLEMYAFCCENNKEYFKNLKLILTYIFSTPTNHKIKSIVAYICARLYRIDSSFCSSLVNKVFENSYNGYNPSYILYSISSDINCDFLKIIKGREDFEEFISLESKEQDIKRSQNILFSRLLWISFVEHNKMPFIELFIKSKNFESIITGFEYAEYWLKNKKITIEQVVLFVTLISNNIYKYNLSRERGVDQLIRKISKILSQSFDNDKKEIWDFLILLFDNFKDYFSDSTFELLKMYKGTSRKSYIIKIMNRYVGSYDMYRTYSETLKKCLLIFKDDKSYKKYYKRWIVQIYNKNPDFSI